MIREIGKFRVSAGMMSITALVATVLTLLAGGGGQSKALEPVPTENLRTCGDHAFPLSVFDQPAGYQKETSGLAAVLRKEIRRDPWFMPKRGWRVVYRDDVWAELVAGKPKKGGNVWVSYRKVDGRWVGESGWSNCWFEPARDGASAGEWFLKKGQRPDPETTELKVDVYETACNSGKPAWGRILAPEIEYRPKSILVTYFVKWKKSRIETCPSNPPLTKTLKLAEPLGERVILDGSRYPYPRRLQIRSGR